MMKVQLLQFHPMAVCGRSGYRMLVNRCTRHVPYLSTTKFIPHEISGPYATIMNKSTDRDGIGECRHGEVDGDDSGDGDDNDNDKERILIRCLTIECHL